jgi:hypothetical protein
VVLQLPVPFPPGFCLGWILCLECRFGCCPSQQAPTLS